MTNFKLGFLNSSDSSTDTRDGPKFKRFFTLRRKRNDARSATLDNPNISTNLSKGLQQLSPEISSPNGEISKGVVTTEALEYNQIFQESERLSRRKTWAGNAKTREPEQSNSGLNIRGELSHSHSSISIIASTIKGSPPLLSQPYIARHAHEQHLKIQSADKRYGYEFRQILQVLQRAARRVQADQSISQASIFRSLAPLASFLYLLGIGVLLPRQQRYRCSSTPDENTSVVKMILFILIGLSLALAVLRGLVWLVGFFGKAFCQVDITQIFRRGKCVDIDGRGMGEAELIMGGLFM